MESQSVSPDLAVSLRMQFRNGASSFNKICLNVVESRIKQSCYRPVYFSLVDEIERQCKGFIGVRLTDVLLWRYLARKGIAHI